jgi:hypothetical protein
MRKLFDALLALALLAAIVITCWLSGAGYHQVIAEYLL